MDIVTVHGAKRSIDARHAATPGRPLADPGFLVN